MPAADRPPTSPTPVTLASPPRRAAIAIVLANLLWLPQAALLAGVIAGWLGAGGAVAVSVAVPGLVGLGVIRAAMTWWAEGVLFDHAEDSIGRLRREITGRESLRAGAGARGSAAIAALAGEKLDLLEPFLTRYGPARLRVMVVPAVLVLVAFSMSWAVAVILLISGPLIPVFMALVGMAAQEASERQMEKIGSLNDLLSERLSALTDIRVLDAGAAVVADFRAQTDGLRARTMAVLRIAFLSSTVLELFAAIGVAMVAVYAGFGLLGALNFGAYATPITAFEAIFLLLLAPEFFQPLRDLAAAWHDKAAAGAVLSELAAWQAQESEAMPGQGVDAPALPGAPGIVVRGLRRALPDGRVLAFPDLKIAPGESVAITGPSGAGKTTLLRMLAGLVRPSAGEVLVAGQVLDADSADAWRARLGWIPQASRFLNASLRRNIALTGQPDAARLEAALQAAAVRDVVAIAPRGLETRLGETGAGLSGGEARRIAIARAHYAAPDVILADEPTADLDPETAEMVTRGLLALCGAGASLIVATHDPALVARLDRAIALEDRG